MFQIPGLDESEIENVFCPETECVSSDIELIEFNRDENILIQFAKKINELEDRLTLLEKSTIRSINPAKN